MSTLAKLLMGVGEAVPDDPGTPYGGGFYAGKFMVAGQAYALVVAPKAQGESPGVQWKTTQTATAGTDSVNDGWSNTQAMIQAGSVFHPAAAFCRGLNINGYDDWYLPSEHELEILYRAFKPTTTNNYIYGGINPSAIPPTGLYTTSNPAQTNSVAFRQGGEEAFRGSIYSSSTGAADFAIIYAQTFSNGEQTYDNPILMHRARAVRRVAI